MFYHGQKNIIIKSISFIFLLACSFTTKQGIEEYNLKAAFIYKFTKYIDWNFSGGEEDFVIGVIGESPIEDALAEIARTRAVYGKPIVIRQFDQPGDIRLCQILFISKNSSFPLNEILAKIPKGVLTISEKAGYAIRGIAIHFTTVNNKLKFEANTR